MNEKSFHRKGEKKIKGQRFPNSSRSMAADKNHPRDVNMLYTICKNTHLLTYSRLCGVMPCSVARYGTFPKSTAMHPHMCTWIATARGFEPLRAEPNGFLVHHLNHSVTLSVAGANCEDANGMR